MTCAACATAKTSARFPQTLRFNTRSMHFPLAPLGPCVLPWPSPVPLPCPSCLRGHEEVDGLHAQWRLVLHQAAGERHGQQRFASHAGHAQHVAGHLQGWRGMDRCGQGSGQGHASLSSIAVLGGLRLFGRHALQWHHPRVCPLACKTVRLQCHLVATCPSDQRQYNPPAHLLT